VTAGWHSTGSVAAAAELPKDKTPRVRLVQANAMGAVANAFAWCEVAVVAHGELVHPKEQFNRHKPALTLSLYVSLHAGPLRC
jgi:hypothetical protein